MGFGVGLGFDLFSILFYVVFLLIIGVFVVAVVKAIGTWNKNNHSPRLTVSAVIVTKRMDVSYHHHANAGDITGAHGYHSSTSTRYFVTFQVESGDRMELSVDRAEYGMLAEGDKGKLSFQGTRYLSFERTSEL